MNRRSVDTYWGGMAAQTHQSLSAMNAIFCLLAISLRRMNTSKSVLRPSGGKNVYAQLLEDRFKLTKNNHVVTSLHKNGREGRAGKERLLFR